MEKVLFLICIPAVLTFLTFQSVEGCSCLRDPLPDLYKKSDFGLPFPTEDLIVTVFIGKLVNKTVENSIDGEPDPDADTNYVVQVFDVYKGDNLVERTKQVYIRTEGFASLCGVDLDVNQYYIFNGMKTMSTEGDPLLTITVCNIMLDSPITPEMWSFVHNALVVMMSARCVEARTC